MTKDIRQLNHHIKLEDNKMVSTQADKPMVSKPTWNPAAGASRQEEIRQARAEALKEIEEQRQLEDPINIRLMQMLGRLDRLEEKVALMMRSLS